MKIGLSYSRCVRDIVDGTVDIEDVLIVIARTDFDPRDDKQWDSIWHGYHGRSGWIDPEWADYDDQDLFRSVSIELWDSGKLHQPRKFGAQPRRLPYHWLETVLSDSDLENSPAVKDAWDRFQVISGLANTPLKAHNE